MKCRLWLKQRGAIIEEEGPTELGKKTEVLLNKRRSKFFESLPDDKKIVLLKKTAAPTYPMSNAFVREVADELALPVTPQLTSWLKHKKRRVMGYKKLSSEMMELLKREYKASGSLKDERVLLLADRFNVLPSLIKKWFIETRFSEQEAESKSKPKKKVESAKTTGAGKFKYKSAEQKTILFEGFKQSPGSTTLEMMNNLVAATNLSAIQVSKWLSCIRVKWAQSTESGLKRILTRNLNEKQLIQLETRYRAVRFISKNEASIISKNSNINHHQVSAWFSYRRIYEVLSNDKDLTTVEPRAEEEDETTPQEEETISDGKVSKTDKNELFFKSLSKHQQLRLLKATKSYNTSYRRIANQLSLPVDEVQSYIQYKRIGGVQMVCPNAKTLPPNVVKALIARYNQSTSIKKSQCIILAKQWKIQPSQIKNWFFNRRKLEKKLEIVGKRTESNETNEPEILSEAEVETPNVEEPETESVEEPESSTESEAVKPRRRICKDITQKNVLFEEYKKNPQISASRVNALASKLRLTPNQVRKWFSNFKQRYLAQTEVTILNVVKSGAISDEKLAKLEDEYCKNRFVSELKNDNFAKQLGLSTRLVRNWFINARYYEVMYNKTPGCERFQKTENSVTSLFDQLPPETISRLNVELKSFPFDDEEKLQSLADELELPPESLKSWFKKSSSTKVIRTKKNPWRYGSGRFTAKKLNFLKVEFQKNEYMSDERARVLCAKIKISMDRIKTWFENRRKLKAEAGTPSPTLKETSLKFIGVRVPAIEKKVESISTSEGIVEDEPVLISPSQSKNHSSVATPKTEIITPSKKSYSCKMPLQQNKLFEEFKTSPSLSARRLERLTKEVDLSAKQISAWFQWMRSKLSNLSKDNLVEEIRNKDLTNEQVERLEKEYLHNRYVSREKREDLSTLLGVSKNVVKMWFANRRYSEILWNTPHEEESEETVIDYDWEENAETGRKDSKIVDPLAELTSSETEINIKRELVFEATEQIVNIPIANPDAIFEPVNEEFSPSTEKNSDLSQQIALEFDEDLSSKPFEERTRFITPLDNDLEPTENDIESLFWFIKKNPKRKGKAANHINEEKNRCLEIEFEKNPWPELDRILYLSKMLKVSEPSIAWWFMKKRCYLTKTISIAQSLPTKPAAPFKNVLIDLTDDDPANSADKPDAHDIEFVALNDQVIKKEDFVDESNSANENVDVKPFEQESELDESMDSKPPISNSDENISSLAQKKKKKKIILTSHQRAILLQEFRRCKYISGPKARMLAQDLGLTVAKVDAWFENMRSNVEKKINPSATSTSLLKDDVKAELEKEFQKSHNLSEKRSKMIAIKLKLTKKIVLRWFYERMKKKDE